MGETQGMLHYQGLLLHMWVEACNTIVFVHNIIPHRIPGMSTQEDFLGKIKNVLYFKIFGSYVYFHVTKDVRKKLEPTIELGIFVGYNDTPHKYRVYFLAYRMTMVRRDVKLNEQKAMQLSL